MNQVTSFVISEFTNPSGEIVYRVSGWLEGKRIRKNFATRVEALAERQVFEIQRLQAETGVRPAWALYEWRRLYAPRPGAGGPTPQTLEEALQENGRLRAEVVRMRERESVLKKSLGILSEPPESGMPRSKR
jgi:transposase-like protein